MPRGIGIRWWLAFAFAGVAATTAFAVAEVFSEASRDAFRDRAQAIAAGNAFQAAIDVRSVPRVEVASVAARVGEERELSIFVFSEDGALLTDPRSRGVDLADVPEGEEALATALDGGRFVTTDERLRATVVAIPLQGGDAAAMIVYASHPDLAASAGIVRDEIVRAALWAIVLGAAVGLVLAWLVARRLRRIAAAARAIEQGDFDQPLAADFGDEVGQLAATIDAMRDRLRESFARMETQRDRFRLLLERQQDGVLAVEPDLRVAFANPAASQLVRADEGEMLPEIWEGALRRFAAALFSTDDRVVEEEISVDDDHVYRLTGVPPRRAGDAAVVVIADLSVRSRAERAEREFVTNAAHELRTPLTTILGATEILQGGAKHDPADRDRFLAHIEREAARLVRLTRALLVLARAQTRAERPRAEAIDLGPMLETVRAGMQARPGVEVDVHCAPGLAVLGDRDLLEQALTNVTANAAAHTMRGRITVTARRDDGRVVVDVADTGVGIPQADRDRVLDRFFRGTGGGDGFGLGLAIVRQAVDALDGTITIDDVPAGGTRVRMTLPAVERGR